MKVDDLGPDTVIRVRRHWNDWKIGSVLLDKLSGLHWDTMSGGVGRASPRPMIYGYMLCTDLVSGEVAHSGAHGPCPHRIKVVVVKKDNDKRVVEALVALCDADQASRRRIYF